MNTSEFTEIVKASPVLNMPIRNPISTSHRLSVQLLDSEWKHVDLQDSQ